MGKKGLNEVQMNSYNATHYLFDEVTKLPKFDKVFNHEFFKDVAIKTDLDPNMINDKLYEEGILGPLHLGKYDKKMENILLFSATEKRTKGEIDSLVRVLGAL